MLFVFVLAGTDPVATVENPALGLIDTASIPVCDAMASSYAAPTHRLIHFSGRPESFLSWRANFVSQHSDPRFEHVFALKDAEYDRIVAEKLAAVRGRQIRERNREKNSMLRDLRLLIEFEKRRASPPRITTRSTSVDPTTPAQAPAPETSGQVADLSQATPEAATQATPLPVGSLDPSLDFVVQNLGDRLIISDGLADGIEDNDDADDDALTAHSDFSLAAEFDEPLTQNAFEEMIKCRRALRALDRKHEQQIDAFHKDLDAANRFIHSALTSAMTMRGKPDQQIHTHPAFGCFTAAKPHDGRGVWVELHKKYAADNPTRLGQLKSKLHSLRQSSSETMGDFIHRINLLVGELEGLGFTPQESDLKSILIAGSLQVYHQPLQTHQIEKKRLDEYMLQSHPSFEPKEESFSQLCNFAKDIAAQVEADLGRRRRTEGANVATRGPKTCYHCGKGGHTVPECRSKKRGDPPTPEGAKARAEANSAVTNQKGPGKGQRRDSIPRNICITCAHAGRPSNHDYQACEHVKNKPKTKNKKDRKENAHQATAPEPEKPAPTATANACWVALVDLEHQPAGAFRANQPHSDQEDPGLTGFMLDSGCTWHMSPFKEDFVDLRPQTVDITGIGGSTQGTATGDIIVPTMTTRNKLTTIVLKNALYVPGLRHRLVSIAALKKTGQGRTNFGAMTINQPSGHKVPIVEIGNLYYFHRHQVVTPALRAYQSDAPVPTGIQAPPSGTPASPAQLLALASSAPAVMPTIIQLTSFAEVANCNMAFFAKLRK